MRKFLSYLPDLTLLRLLGGNVRPLILGLESGSSISSLEAWSDPQLLPQLKLDGTIFCFFPSILYCPFIDVDFSFVAMLKKISLKKLAQLAEDLRPQARKQCQPQQPRGSPSMGSAPRVRCTTSCPLRRASWHLMPRAKGERHPPRGKRNPHQGQDIIE